MLLFDRFRQSLAEFGLTAPGTVVVGVSGGLDSTVLLDLLRAADLSVTVAHVNYGLRGAASDEDESFVRSIAVRADVPCFVHHAQFEGASVQTEARAIRYRFFGHVAEQVGALFVATAHHREDQAETLLLNLFRGAGPVGLAGIPTRRALSPESRVTVVRPLLATSRADILAHAQARGLRWREDASNRATDYRRNVVRNEILPLVERHFDGASNRIAHTASLLHGYLDSGSTLASGAEFDAAKSQQETRALRVDRLTSHPETVRGGMLLEALRRWAPNAPRSAASVRELDALLYAQPGRRVAWPGVTVWRERESIVFVSTEEERAEVDLTVASGETHTPFGNIYIEPLETVPPRFDSSPHVEVVDSERLRWPLRLRTWRDGDAIRPLGLDGRKKVSDLLTERRVPSHQRRHQLVLLSGDEVVWAVGHRLSTRVAVGPETTQAVRFVWNPASPLAPDDEGR